MTRRRLALAVLATIALLIVVFLGSRPSPLRPGQAPVASGSGGPVAPSTTGVVSVHVFSSGRDVAGAKVGIVTDRAGIQDLAAGATTLPDGRARLSGLPLGRHRLVVTHPHFRRAEREIEVVADDTGIEIELVTGAEVEVIVVDQRGQPVAEARLVLMQGSREVRSAVSGAAGTFLFGGLDPGSYVVHVVAAGRRARDGPQLQLDEPGQRVAQRIQLEDGRVLAGRVVDERGAPIVEVSVGSSDPSGAITTTDGNGRFELSGLADGPINLFATKPGYAARQLRGIKTGARNVELTLERPGAVQGEIVLQGKSKSLMVSACQRDPHFGKEICLARKLVEPEAGSFLLENLPSGSYDLVLEADGHGTERVRFTARPGLTVSVGSVTLRSQ